MNNIPGFDSILKATLFAVQKHHGQFRKDDNRYPFIIHPLTAAHLIVSIGKIEDPIIIAAAILHDTIEDTSTKPAEIARLFGDEVLNLVLEVSDDKSLPKDRRKQLQIIHAPALSCSAKIIKIADKLANCQDVLNTPPHGWSIKRCQDYIQWAADVVWQFHGTNLPLENAFNDMLAEAENKLNFKLEHLSTLNNRPWAPEGDAFTA